MSKAVTKQGIGLVWYKRRLALSNTKTFHNTSCKHSSLKIHIFMRSSLSEDIIHSIYLFIYWSIGHRSVSSINWVIILQPGTNYSITIAASSIMQQINKEKSHNKVITTPCKIRQVLIQMCIHKKTFNPVGKSNCKLQ